MVVMEKRIHLYVSRKNALTWLMALCLVGSAVTRIAFAGLKGSGETLEVWSQIILPVAATLLYVLIVLINGKEMFYKTAIPVWMLGIYYDEPAALETDLMAVHLDKLRHGEAIDCPVYDFTVHNRSDETIRIEPRPVIIVEGILIFENEPLRELMDIRIFVDTDADVRLCRRIKRDVNKRGRSLESVLTQYQTTVKPMHEKYVEPSKKYANIIVPEGGKNMVALDMIMGRIKRHLEEV